MWKGFEQRINIMGLRFEQDYLDCYVENRTWDTGGDRETWWVGPSGRGRDGKVSSLCFSEMADIPLPSSHIT